MHGASNTHQLGVVVVVGGGGGGGWTAGAERLHFLFDGPVLGRLLRRLRIGAKKRETAFPAPETLCLMGVTHGVMLQSDVHSSSTC